MNHPTTDLVSDSARPTPARPPCRAATRKAAAPVTAFAFALLAACGGGGGGDDSGGGAPAEPSAAEGLYVGTADGNRSLLGVVLDDGTYYFIYSRPNSSAAAGVMQGHGSASAGAFTSSDTRDFSIEDLDVYAASVEATYDSKRRLAGTVRYAADETATFTAAYDAAWEALPTLAAVAGSYRGSVAFAEGSESAQVTIGSSGSIAGRGNSGCTVSGSVAPRARGNVYDLAITFGASPCLHADQTFRGIAYYDSAERRLYAAAPNAARDDGILFTGWR